jgi:hypothetical protein
MSRWKVPNAVFRAESPPGGHPVQVGGDMGRRGT